MLKEKMRLWFGGQRVAAGVFRWLYGSRFVSRNTDIVIEGAPSSGNSFAVMAFEMAQDRVKVAHHTHLPLQVIMAAQWGIPCIVLVRDPLDATASLVSRSGRYLPGSYLTKEVLRDCLWCWMFFYRKVLRYLDRCVVCEFERLKMDYSGVISEVNDRFKKRFVMPSRHLQDEALRRLSKRVAPCEARTGLKRQIIEWALQDNEISRLVGYARSLFFRVQEPLSG